MPKLKLHWWILIGMIVGAVAGSVVHVIYPEEVVQSTWIYQAFDGISQLFLNLLKMIVVPLIFFSLVSGMLSMGDVARLGRIGVRTLLLYMMTSGLAVGLGLLLVNLIRPGVGTDLQVPIEVEAKPIPESVWEVLLEMLPGNIVQAAANFDLFTVILFAVMVGAAMLSLTGERKNLLVHLIEGATEIMTKVTLYVLALAPIGIAALIARMTSSLGIEFLWEMRWYVATVFLALGLHALVTLPIVIWVATRRSPMRYFKAISPAMLMGFSTASSNGTLPVTMKQVEEAGVSNRIASFVLPLGATINMDGTALYEIVSVLFIAQLHASADPNFTLTFAQQLLIVFLGLAVSVGAAGIPHAGLVMMVIILQAVGLPIEYTGLIWAVDRVLDMCRTAVNLTSDASISLVVAQGEGELDSTVLWGKNP